MISEYTEMFEEKFKAHYTQSIRAVREGLLDPDIKLRLKAADMYLKAHGKYKEKCKDGGETAEDVIQGIMQMQKAGVIYVSSGHTSNFD